MEPSNQLPITDHLPSHIRAAHPRSFRLPPPSPLSKSGARRNGKQATPTPLITPSHRHHLIRPTSPTDMGQAIARQPGQARDASHRRRPRRQASKARHPTPSPPRSPQRTDEKQERDDDERRHHQPRQPQRNGQASRHPPPHRHNDETHGTRNGLPHRAEQAEQGTGRDTQERTETHKMGR